MEMTFLKVLNMSISASWLVLVVLVLRFLLKKSPRWIHVCLWGLVAIRLVCPISLESAVSLNPVELTDQVMEAMPNSYYGDSSIYGHGTAQYDMAVNAGIEPVEGDNGYRYVVTQPNNPTQPAYTERMIWGEIWLLGMTAMVIYALASYLRLKRKVSASIRLENGVCICDYIDTPFILGIVKPKIYLPSSMEPDSAAHVLAHERSHIFRKDHWWKPLGYLLLTIHWFNPLLWLAYILLCRDIELACDEKVVHQMALKERKSYSDALLACSVKRLHVAACPLAFGEVGVKERVKSVLNYKKPAFWLVLVAVIALTVTAVCFLTDPVQEEEVSEFFINHVYEQEKDRRTQEEIHFIDAKDGFAAVYCSGMGPNLKLYQYEMVDGELRIIAYCGGDYNISGCISMNHVEANGKHIYYGTVSGSHFDPAEPMAQKFDWKSLRITDENGENQELDMEGARGYLAILDAPLADFQVVSVENEVILDYENFLSQGYLVDERHLTSAGTATNIFGRVYRVEQVVYRDPQLSYYMTEEEAPLIQLTEGHYLQTRYDAEDWIIQGSLEQTELTAESFDDWFFGEELGLEEDITLEALREDNRQAWQLFIQNPEDSSRSDFYLLLWQYSGEIYLAQGFEVGSSRHVNWLYRLNEPASSAGDADTFGKFYRVNGTFYESPTSVGAHFYSGENVYLFTAGYGITESSAMSESGASIARVRETALTQANFDALLPDAQDLAVSLRENNDRAWECFNTHQWNADEFCYLLRQKDGTHYIVSGGWDEAEGRESARVGYVYRMQPITSDDPCAEAESPFQWTLNLDRDDLETIRISTQDLDGNAVQIDLTESEISFLLQVLNSVRADEITLGTQDKTQSVHADLFCLEESGRNSKLDVQLSYDGEAVSMTFSEEAAARYPQAAGKTWIIRNQWLNSFFFAYSATPWELDPFADPDNAYQLCRNISSEYVDYTWANEIVPAGDHYSQAQTCQLSQQQQDQLLEILNGLPESVFEKAEYPRGEERGVNIFMRNRWNDHPFTSNAELKLVEDQLYYTFATDWQNPYQTWKIDSAELIAFIESLFEGDRSDWDKFAPFPTTDGEVSCAFGTVEVTIPKMSRFQYEVTGEGIRFKPEDLEDWVLLRYQTEPFAVCGTGLRTVDGQYGDVASVTGYYDNNEAWSFTDLKYTSGDMVFNVVLLNESNALWVEDCYREIREIIYQLSFRIPQSWQSVAYEHGYANMRLSLPEGWENEIIQYSDEQTPFGIRFRPAGEQDWIFVQFWPTGLNQESAGVNSVGNQNLLFFYYEGQDIWRYATFQNQPCGYRIDNGAKDSWYQDYEAQIGAILSSLVVAEGCCDEAEAKALALEYAWENQLLTIYHGGGLPYEYATGFDFTTGNWTVAIEDTHTGETVICCVSRQGVIVMASKE